jgi:hypothetical protein
MGNLMNTNHTPDIASNDLFFFGMQIAATELGALVPTLSLEVKRKAVEEAITLAMRERFGTTRVGMSRLAQMGGRRAIEAYLLTLADGGF